MQKKSNLIRLIAMFFVAAMLFAMGPVQGSIHYGSAPTASYAFDLGPPVAQSLMFISVSKTSQPVMIARGVSVPIKGLIMSNLEIVTSVNGSGIIYNKQNFNQDILPAIIDRYCLQGNSNNVSNTRNYIHFNRARKKL